jgi:hypothetical protein
MSAKAQQRCGAGGALLASLAIVLTTGMGNAALTDLGLKGQAGVITIDECHVDSGRRGPTRSCTGTFVPAAGGERITGVWFGGESSHLPVGSVWKVHFDGGTFAYPATPKDTEGHLGGLGMALMFGVAAIVLFVFAVRG